MALVDPYDGPGTADIEREAILFAVLRERVRPVEASLVQADEEISAWLDEAEEEGARILERARAEAAREAVAIRTQVHALRADLVGLLERVDTLLPALEAVPAEPPIEAPAPQLVLLPGPPSPRRSRLSRLLRRW
jgi:hypothetical protein